MPRRVVVHVGPPKSGTTYIQRALRTNSANLREHGWHDIVDQRALRRAASELVGVAPVPEDPVPRGAWDRLRTRVLAESGDVVISCERFSLLGEDEVRRMRDELPAAELHALLTFRDIATVLPSRWQERVKNGARESWPAFCAQVAREPAFLDRMTRMRSALVAWTEGLGPDRVHVVTVPPPGAAPSVLAARFARAAGIPEGCMAVPPEHEANRSIGLAGSELLRLINAHGAGVSRAVRRTQIKGYLATQVLVGRSDELPVLPVAAHRVARAETQRVKEELRARGPQVFGDLADLDHQPAPVVDRDSAVSPEAVIDAALDAILAMAQRCHDDETRVGVAEPARTRRRGGWLRRE